MRHRSAPVWRTRVAGLGAAVLLLAVVAGTPLLLTQIGQLSIPDRFPTWAQVETLLTGPDDGRILLGALTLVGWSGWAWFTVAVLTEVITQLRGGHARHLPGLGPAQQLAARLVTAALLAIPVAQSVAIGAAPALASTPAATASAVSAQEPVTAVSAPTLRQTTASHPTSQAPAVAAVAGTERVYLVQQRDTMWGIAERELGDGHRWSEIAQLNYGQAQPDGHALTDAHWINPGWQLLLPAAPAGGASAVTPSGAGPTHAYTVQTGDTLSGIADAEYDDPGRWPVIADANAGRVQPDGRTLTDPDLIYPGWVLEIPTASTPSSTSQAPDVGPAAPPGSEAPARPPPGEQQTGAGSTDDGAAVAPPGPAVPAPGPAAPAPPAATAPSAATGSSSISVEPGARSSTSPAETSDRVIQLSALAGAGLLAAGLVGALARRRRRAEQTRRSGERPARPHPEVARTELAMRARADHEHARALAGALGVIGPAAAGRLLPHVLAVELTHERLRLHFDGPVPEPAGDLYQRVTDTAWQLDAAARARLDDADAAAGEGLLPGLVTLGHTDGGYLLVNLEVLGMAGIAGDDPAAVIDTAAMELASSPWGGWMELTLIGVGFDELAGLERVTCCDRVEDVLPVLRARAADVQASLAEAGTASVMTARLADVHDDRWTLTVVVTREPLDEDTYEQLAGLVGYPARGALAVLAPAAGEAPLELEDGRLYVEPLGLSVTPQQLDPEDYRLIGEVFASVDTAPVPASTGPVGEVEPEPRWVLDELTAPAAAGEDTETLGTAGEPAGIDLGERPAGGYAPFGMGIPVVERDHGSSFAAAPVPAVPVEAKAAEPGPDPVETPAVDDPLLRPPPVEVCVLGPGPVEVRGLEAPLSAGLPTELVLFLALRGRTGADAEHITMALSRDPDQPMTRASRHRVLSRLRAGLGAAADGTSRLQRSSDGTYRLGPDVGLDYARFTRLVERDETAFRNGGGDGREDLRAALGLVHGRPLDRVLSWWREEAQAAEMAMRIVDAAERLTELELASGQPRLAVAAARAGLRADPSSERLIRVLMRAQHAAGDTSGVRSAFGELLEAINQVDPYGDPHPDTLALYDELIGRRRLTASTG